MSIFQGTAAYYSRYRPGLPTEVIERLIEEANRHQQATTLLDLGTGTGQVIEAIHQNFVDIIAVEADAEMLAFARSNLASILSADKSIRFYHSRAEAFFPPEGWSASFVTICRAFHWMEQGRVLEQLSFYVPDHGAVAVFGERVSFWDADTPWKKAMRQLIQSFLGEQRRAGAGVFSHHARPYSEILRESPFGKVEEFAFPVRRTWNTEGILGLLYSSSFAARPLFGEKIEEFEKAVRATLAQHSDSDSFKDENEFLVLIGRKRS